MDMVASLEWVRDNIAAFGGDPSRVMIFGQSGGGSKTSTLLAHAGGEGAVPSRRGAERIDAAARRRGRRGRNRRISCFKKLGIARNRIADIQRLPWEQLLEAQAGIDRAAFTPVMDGRYLPHHPFDPAAPPESRDVPVIISTTLEDAALRLTNWDLTERGADARCSTSATAARRARSSTLYRPVTDGQDAVPDPGAGLHRQRRRGRAPSRRPSARRRRAAPASGCTSGSGRRRASTASSAPCTATTSTRRSTSIATASAAAGREGRPADVRRGWRRRGSRSPRPATPTTSTSRTGRPTTRPRARR